MRSYKQVFKTFTDELRRSLYRTRPDVAWSDILYARIDSTDRWDTHAFLINIFLIDGRVMRTINMQKTRR